MRPFVRGECVLGILLPRTNERLFIEQPAVLKAGAAYNCPDPAFAVRERLLPDRDMGLVTGAHIREVLLGAQARATGPVNAHALSLMLEELDA
jgi:hypothetical protein